MDSYFDAIVVSDEVGVGKPDPGIFQHALDHLDCSPREVPFIGDSLRDDCHGAVNVGNDFVYYNRRQAPLGTEHRPRFHLTQLPDPPERLGGLTGS